MVTVGRKVVKNMTEKIKKLFESRGLGDIVPPIVSVSGGFMHKMYKVCAGGKFYAVKYLNPEIMKRPGAMDNYIKAEKLEAVLEENNIPIVPALSINNVKMQEMNGDYFYIFNWQEGSITDWNAITIEQCRKAGYIQGKIHSIDFHHNECSDEMVHTERMGKMEHTKLTEKVVNIEPVENLEAAGDKGQARYIEHAEKAEQEFEAKDFKVLIKEAKAQSSEIYPLLEENESLLEYASAQIHSARKSLPDIESIIDDDMDPKNVIWHEGNPVVIDLECLDYGNPVSSVIQLSLQWAGITTCSFDPEKMKAFFDGYLEAYDNGFKNYAEVFGLAYSWIEWLEYNIARALGRSSDENERQLGISEVRNTVTRIKYIRDIEKSVKKLMSEIFI